MKSATSLLLISTILVFGTAKFTGSTLSAVTLAGGVIKSKYIEHDKKYKRKDCPVCKGLGWYISGDKISKVDCGYCEPEKTPPQSQQPNDDCKTKIIRR